MSGPISARPKRLWLIGMMGCGKSAVGKRLSPLIAWPYVDNDQMLLVREGLDLVDLAHDSPERLHDAELAMVHTLATREPPLIAGIPASLADHPTELEQLTTSGHLVYLRATPQTLTARTAATHRPFLERDPLTWTARTLTRRAPNFERYADLFLDTDLTTPQHLARTLAQYVTHATTNQQEPI